MPALAAHAGSADGRRLGRKSYGATVQMPPMAVHCRAVRHTSDGVQSALLAAMQTLPSRVHFPAKLHWEDFLQSALERATHAPFSA